MNRYHVIMKDLKIPRNEPREMSEELARRLLPDVEWTIGNRMIFLKVTSLSLAFIFFIFKLMQDQSYMYKRPQCKPVILIYNYKKLF